MLDRYIGFRTSILIYPLLFILSISTISHAEQEESRWEETIQAFEEKDKENPPPQGAVLFIGSSSIRGWDLVESFPGLPAINRGFGGSHVSDSVEFAHRIAIPYKPKTVVLYAGDNDIASGKTPETVLNDFKVFVKIIHSSLPTTRIVFVPIKPSISRWNLIGEMRKANAMIREICEQDQRLQYVDIDTPMIGPDGRPRVELFKDDGLHLNKEGYKLWSALVYPYLETSVPKEEGKILVATCQFPVSSKISMNAAWIRKQMRDAKESQADIVHFSEVALSGYAGVDRESMDDYNWKEHAAELDSIRALAKELRLWVVLGAVHRLTEPNKPHNSLYVINPQGKIIDRYDKRFCTGGDLKHFSPGDHFVTFDVNGARCGLLICYDIRFPELYRQYNKLGVRLMFHSFHNARQKEGSIHPKIMPPTAQARAASNNMFISMNNSCAPRSWQSLFITPDGLIQERLPLDQPGVMINLVDVNKKYYDASRPYRIDCIDGKWNSGEVVDDPRSKDRQSY